MWLKMSEVAKELGVSKDVVKYHRKSISDDFLQRKNNEIYISPEGVEWIKSRLKKDSYHANFETYTRSKLKEVTGQLDWIQDVLLDKLIVNPGISNQTNNPSADLPSLIKEELTNEFIQWYCQYKEIEEWADWRYKFITLEEFLLYLSEKNNNVTSF